MAAHSVRVLMTRVPVSPASLKLPRQAATALTSSHFLQGAPLRLKSCSSVGVRPSPSAHRRSAVVARAQAETESAADASARLRLNNLSPQPGARRQEKRKGRGYGAGQGGTCGFGMRGQRSRSGPKVRPGFEGGQMPLYRRLPKLKGIAGGMGAGLPKYVNVNLDDINSLGLPENAEVSLEELVGMGLLKPSGRERKLPLKVLGDGEISTKLTVRAAAFSAAAREKLEAAGCTLVEVPGKKKFLCATALKKQERTAKFFAAKDASA